jgi:hypothetical protein
MQRRNKPIHFDDHAIQRMQQRGVSRDQVLKAVRDPHRSRTPKRAGARRFERKFSSKRRLAVIADETSSQIIVISVFWM